MGKQMRVILTWLVIGLLLGLWFGVNIGRNVPFYSNPFAAVTVQEKLKQSVGEGVSKMGAGVEKLGETIKGKEQQK